MKKVILFAVVCCLFLCVSEAGAQKKRTPVKKKPTPMVKTAPEELLLETKQQANFKPGPPDADGWSLYESKSDLFKAAFPPTPVVADMVDENGQKDGKRYYNPDPVTPVKISLTLMVTSLGTSVIDPDLKRRLYAGWIEGVMSDDGSGKKAVKVSDKEFVFGDSFGMEIIVDREDFRFHGRIVCPSGSCYQLAVGSASPGSAAPGEYVEVEKWKKKFFDSFQFIKTPPPTEPIFGKVENGIYTNSVLGLSLAVPSGWHMLDMERTAADRERAKLLLQGDNAYYNKLLEENLKSERTVLRYGKNPSGTPGNPSMGISVLKLTPGFPLLERTAATTREALMAGNLSPQVSPVQIKYLGKTKMAVINSVMNVNGLQAKQRLHLIQTRGYGISIVLTYIDELDLVAMEKSMETLRFK